MATIKQKVLPVLIEKNGDLRELYYQNRGKDVTVGNLSKASSLRLPANTANEQLETSLQYIKAYLFNLENVAATKYTVSGSNQIGGANSLATSAAVKLNFDAIQALQGNVGDATGDISGKAPVMHSADTIVYGGATGAKYGHVKLSDIYNAPVFNGYNSAADSIGASQKALYTAYDALNTSKASNNHASTTNQYGVGNNTNWGHVKVFDDYTISRGNASSGITASQKAVYDLYTAYCGTRDTLNDMTINIMADLSGGGSVQLCQYYHADANGAKHGIGTTLVFGHVKLSDTYEEWDHFDVGKLDTENPANLNYDNNFKHALDGVGVSEFASMAGDRTCLMYTHNLMVNHRKEKASPSFLGHVRLSITSYGEEEADGSPKTYDSPSMTEPDAVSLYALHKTSKQLSERIYALLEKITELGNSKIDARAMSLLNTITDVMPNSKTSSIEQNSSGQSMLIWFDDAVDITCTIQVGVIRTGTSVSMQLTLGNLSISNKQNTVVTTLVSGTTNWRTYKSKYRPLCLNDDLKWISGVIVRGVGGSGTPNMEEKAVAPPDIPYTVIFGRQSNGEYKMSITTVDMANENMPRILTDTEVINHNINNETIIALDIIPDTYSYLYSYSTPVKYVEYPRIYGYGIVLPNLKFRIRFFSKNSSENLTLGVVKDKFDDYLTHIRTAHVGYTTSVFNKTGIYRYIAGRGLEKSTSNAS